MSFRWYRCHECAREYPLNHPDGDQVRPSWGCICERPTLHIHSDKDGELPYTGAMRDLRLAVQLQHQLDAAV